MPKVGPDLFAKARAYTKHREIQAKGLYPYFRPAQSGSGPQVVVGGRKMIMIGSNNYLGLSQHPKVKAAAKAAIDKYGSGCTGSRFLNGTLEIHEELEQRLARFVRKEMALCFSTGFQTNLGIISALAGKDDVILCDRMNHASIYEGCRLSFAETIKYRHNDMRDLERTLQNLHEEGRQCGRFIITDGIFSMEGDIANLPEIVRLKDKYNCRVLCDDAHSTGVLGKRGAGTAEHFGLEQETDLIMSTFSKSFASLGGFVAGPSEVIEYIKHTARSLIFSASMPPPCVATVLACLDIMERDPEPRERVWHNTRKMLAGFKQLGFNIGLSQTPVIPVIVGELERVFTFWKMLFEAGIYCNPIVPPAVPAHMGLLRTSYMATHTEPMLDRVLDTFERVGKKLGIIH
jgi:8-amino-7-oxononanoate synthase